MARSLTPITRQESAERRERVGRALASVRLEGLEPTDAAKAIFDRYVAGGLTTEQMAAEIRALNAREFEPRIRLRGLKSAGFPTVNVANGGHSFGAAAFIGHAVHQVPGRLFDVRWRVGEAGRTAGGERIHHAQTT
jgi:hypothetical protein